MWDLLYSKRPIIVDRELTFSLSVSGLGLSSMREEDSRLGVNVLMVKSICSVFLTVQIVRQLIKTSCPDFRQRLPDEYPLFQGLNSK